MTKGLGTNCGDSYFGNIMTFDESAIRIVIENTEQTINVKIPDKLQEEVVMKCDDLKSQVSNLVASYQKVDCK